MTLALAPPVELGDQRWPPVVLGAALQRPVQRVLGVAPDLADRSEPEGRLDPADRRRVGQPPRFLRASPGAEVAPDAVELDDVLAGSRSSR
jgi:hypothetical protein